MEYLWIVFAVVGLAAAAVLIGSYVCFRMAFYVPDSSRPDPEEIQGPDGSIYVPYHDDMYRWAREMRAMPQRHVYITSHDGLRLHARFFEYAPGASVEIMFHGYRGTAERDLSGGVQRCFSLGRSVLLVDQRAHGESEGRTISFGAKERLDCLSWIRWANEHFGCPEIALFGVSMGAGTVLLATALDLPENVLCAVADCPYSRAEDVITAVGERMHMPRGLTRWLARGAARVFGGFRLKDASPADALRQARIPVLLLHGEADRLVPCEMSAVLEENCASTVVRHTFPGAGHGLSYLVDRERYTAAVIGFVERCRAAEKN